MEYCQKPKKAIILAAGLGTRLRPLTDKIPKPLLLIGDKPLLQYHLDQLSLYGIDDILINTHYLSEQIKEFVEKYQNKHPGVSIRVTYEEVLLGSAGTLLINKSFFEDEEDIFVVYGDNLTTLNYKAFIDNHIKSKSIVTIACYEEERPESKGILETDIHNRIMSFIEKPKSGTTTSRKANAGIYAINKKIVPYLSLVDKSPLDFGYDVFPYLLTQGVPMSAYIMNEFILDIGTPDSYSKAQQFVLDFK